MWGGYVVGDGCRPRASRGVSWTRAHTGRTSPTSLPCFVISVMTPRLLVSALVAMTVVLSAAPALADDPPPDPAPVDLCTNLEGTQGTVPEGHEDPEGDGVCTLAPVTPPGVAWTAKELGCLRGVQVNGARSMGTGTVRYRGRRYSENTLPADAMAGSLACGFEGDLRQGPNGCIVRQHDTTYRRMTNGGGYVRHRSCARSRHYRTASGARVATAHQTIDAMARSMSCFAVLEIKSMSHGALANLLTYAARRLKSRQCLRVTSGSLTQLARVKRIDDQFPTGWIRFSNSSRPSVGRVPRLSVDMIMVHHSQATRSYVAAAKAHGLEVSARKVTTRSVFDRVKRAGVTNVNGKAAVVGRLR